MFKIQFSENAVNILLWRWVVFYCINPHCGGIREHNPNKFKNRVWMKNWHKDKVAETLDKRL